MIADDVDIKGILAPRWVPTRLKLADQLGNFRLANGTQHVAPEQHNLAKLFSTTPQEIVKRNGADFTSNAIEGKGGMLERAGSKRYFFDRYFIDDDTTLLLPYMPNSPRTQIVPVTPKGRTRSLWVPGVLVGLVGVAMGKPLLMVSGTAMAFRIVGPGKE